MEKEFLSYELAFDLKRLGFNERCLAYFNESSGRNDFHFYGRDLLLDTFAERVDTPLYQQAFRWFRETHHMYSVIEALGDLGNWGYLIETSDYKQKQKIFYKSYEEAQDSCLRMMIELLAKQLLQTEI
jgi:hypothetical protein